MKKQLIVSLLLVCIASMVIAPSLVAQTTVTPGVNVGDDYFYTTYGYWTSSSAYTSIPQTLVTANQTQGIEVRVSEANGTWVTTFTATYYVPPTSPDAERGSLNIQTGDTSGTPWPAIIGANLTAGSVIHPLGLDGITVNDTTTFEGRDTNEIVFNYYNATTGITDITDRLFDKQTGMLVKEVDTETDDGSVSGSTYTSILTTLVYSSPWDPSQTLPITTPTTTNGGTSNTNTNTGQKSSSGWGLTYDVAIAAVVIVVVAVVALLYMRSRQNTVRRKPHTHLPPPPPPPSPSM